MVKIFVRIYICTLTNHSLIFWNSVHYVFLALLKHPIFSSTCKSAIKHFKTRTFFFGSAVSIFIYVQTTIYEIKTKWFCEKKCINILLHIEATLIMLSYERGLHLRGSGTTDEIKVYSEENSSVTKMVHTLCWFFGHNQTRTSRVKGQLGFA